VSLSTDTLPLSETVTPDNQRELALRVREAQADSTAIYPLGGEASLDFGLVPRTPGVGLSTSALDRVIDYPVRDMTITVESGITMAALGERLAAENQRLPIDVPRPRQATLGGVVATNFSGPRRYGCGTIRDYVIGITAVDGRGMTFRGGGQVVKNVAGYDFCKLLTGSLGTLGVITQITLKIRPQPEASAFVACKIADFDQAERCLAQLVTSPVTPTAIQWLAGPSWSDDPALPHMAGEGAGYLVIGLEGTRVEVDWMAKELAADWNPGGGLPVERVAEDQVSGLWQRFSEFPASGESPLVLKASILPSSTGQMIGLLRAFDPQCSILAHAGSGIVLARLSTFKAEDASRELIGRWHPFARRAGGHLIMLSADPGLGLTRAAVWGGSTEAWEAMRAVKEQFDPQGLLNPGRFIF